MKDDNMDQRWKSSGSYCEVTTGEDGLLHFEGTYYLDGVAFPFTCNEQASGPKLLRGQVKVYSKQKGQYMRIREKGENRAPELLKKDIYPPVLDKKGALLPREKWERSVQERVEYAAKWLLDKHMVKIKRDTELAVSPSDITPQMALILYCDAFFCVKHAGAAKNSLKDYERMISKLFRFLPNIPMSKIKACNTQKAVKDSNASKQAQKLARDFWAYCLDARHAEGSNPFPAAEKRRKSAEAKQAAADRLDVLDAVTQEAIYETALANASAADCGLALILWGGFPPKYIVTLLWGNLISLPNGQILVPYHIDDNAGATHNYSRILMPQAAEILNKRHANLLTQYGKTRAKKMPVAALSSKPEKAMRPDDLCKYAAAMLQRLAISATASVQALNLTGSGAVSLCLRTYEHNLTYACHIKEDSGLNRFLSGKSLAGNVTADHYRSFTDPSAVELQCSYFRRMAPESPIVLEQAVDTSHPEYDVFRFAAPTTKDLISLSLTLDDLSPDDNVSILSRYGGDVHIEYKAEPSAIPNSETDPEA